VALGAVLALVSAGCVLSVEQAYTQRDLIFEPALLGEWALPKGESAERVLMTRTDSLEYAVVYTDRDGQAGRFVGHLARVHGVLLFDLLPVPLPNVGNTAYRDQFTRMHLILRIDRTSPTLQYRYLNEDSLRLRFSETPVLHGWSDGDKIYLTSSTGELQDLVSGRSLPDRVLWTRAIQLTRASSASGADSPGPSTK
jgi:hypothetical protein